MTPEMSPDRPLGIFGGTFDPIHIAHLRLAQEALDACALGAVRFIPAGQPPHRARPGATSADRLAMARLALAGSAQFELDEAEVLSDAPSYTVPTLERLRGLFGQERPLVLLLGVDAFLGLPGWHRWRELFDLAHIAVATRPGHVMDFTSGAAKSDAGRAALEEEFAARQAPSPDALSATPAGRISHFEMTPLEISATAIRAVLAAGRSPRFLVPDGVLDYIEAQRLYI
ncbi:nicotinate-nucleotide adenylyltransferase [Uliginosibacterium sp. H3]|uniref:Probable nicotinate-nucleotide adenylyltransferase n=1 Tax=Uliginosibacterium silvisoli TaxID=3114758 RepID=A0ABU6K1Z7_9RHOO|nr:nicotinate-nucleotide adenylyltransferase [Uliginosibacterium sp. H3]